jgi:hypothetical protein
MMTALMSGKPLEQKMTVTVNFLDLSPPRSGAVIPEFR